MMVQMVHKGTDYHDFFGILILLIINSTISFIEENNAGNAAAALMARLAPKAKVLRDGKWSGEDASVLVPGDIVSIKLGDIVPADARLLEGDPLKIDQPRMVTTDLLLSGASTKQDHDFLEFVNVNHGSFILTVCGFLRYISLRNNKPLQASVRAVTSGTLWALKREDFRGILTLEFSNLSSLKLLRSVDLLSRLTILQLSHIAESLSEVSFSDGQIIADRQIKALLESVGTSFCPDYLDWFGNGATDSHSRNADQSVLSKFLQAHPADFSTTKLQVEHLLRDVKDTTISTLATEDVEGLIVLNIGSYMGGVNLWQNDYEHDDDFNLQSMHDKTLEVVCISGAWHLGKLQVQNLGFY
ncbi:hypothetical protein TEA_028458 [Camellia sinensis var. sinensis]|uniref:Cyclic nucleotide-binding domain-containing protein n=1 Tax=Camellia sinensis var. sinensis TaxID=542762 RepID=A0A4S4CZ39_CAMSN|nr:hypothetical protein TEA_028458 [Camellia sinensis var. sinensis]